MPDLPGPVTRRPRSVPGQGSCQMTYTLIPGQSHTASEEETLSMIRSVLTEDVDPPKVEAPAAGPAPRDTKVERAFV